MAGEAIPHRHPGGGCRLRAAEKQAIHDHPDRWEQRIAEDICSRGSVCLDGQRRRITDLLEANSRFEQDGRNWRIVEQLRAGDGHSVTLVNDNPDFDGPGAFVECSGDWTEWEVLKFTGDNVDAALGAAFVAFRKWSRDDAGN
ncbi:hypothetical protein NKG99_04130 [Mesorhizobium sp. M1409]|uniref:hypothetical protein n=1 Tax=Mesorhizobium sp. M1409 TaxID=2957100 RepID=UPI00333A8036